MNYGKNQVDNRRKALKKRSRRRRHRGAASVLKIFVATFFIVVALSLGAFALYAGRLISQLPDISEVDVSPNGFQTHVLDKDGNEIETLASTGANREYVTIDQIPLNLQRAFVAIEDRKFYDHNGIDPLGIVRAGINGIMNKLRGGSFDEGASTITQQLLKNNYFSGWTSEATFQDSLERKIQEQYMAVQLEKVLDKDQILEYYLNTINLGQNTLGVEAASQRYFNKHVSELTLSESAVIAGITQNPSRFNPIRNPEDNAQRRLKVLDDMLELGFISQTQHDEAIQDDVYSRIAIVNSELASSTTSYFVDALCDQVVDDLVNELGYSESEAYSKLYSGGLIIHSTQDPRIQQICDEEINNQENYGGTPRYSFSYRLTIQKPDESLENYSDQTMLSYYQSRNSNYNINYNSEEEARAAIEAYKAEIMEEGDIIPEGGEKLNITLQPQTAISIIDQSTGNVAAIVGGRGDKTASRTLNRATGITRQPGSTFKIIAAYAPAIDAGGYGLGTVIDDAPMSYANGASLRNYDGHYRGFSVIRTGIQYSINVMAVKALTDVGTGLGLQYAQDFGITSLPNTDNNQALALGGLTYGVSNIELTGAYATIANGGMYNRPVFYTTVTDNRGNIILDTTDDTPRQVIKDTTAYMLTDAMKTVMTAGTGGPANFSGQAVAGKSGTTTSNRDTLFAGFTPYYTCTIWGGYDDNAVQNSTAYSKTIWRKVMSRIHEGLPYKDFDMPSGLTRIAVCSKSGKLPVEGLCDMDPRGSTIVTELFAANNAPTDSCDHHTSLTICTESRLPAGPYCPEELIESGVFIIGGSPGTDDGEYLLSEEVTTGECNIHGPGNGVDPEQGDTENTPGGGIHIDITPNTPTNPYSPPYNPYNPTPVDPDDTDDNDNIPWQPTDPGNVPPSDVLPEDTEGE